MDFRLLKPNLLAIDRYNFFKQILIFLITFFDFFALHELLLNSEYTHNSEYHIYLID
jgi:hypothetical protein